MHVVKYSPNSYTVGRRALFSYRARYDVIEFSHYRIEKNEAKLSSFAQSENEMVIEQNATSYVLTVSEHSYMQSDVIAWTVL